MGDLTKASEETGLIVEQLLADETRDYRTAIYHEEMARAFGWDDDEE